MEWILTEILVRSLIGCKGKARPRKGHEGSEWGVDVELYSFFNLGARWGGCSAPRYGRSTSGKNPLPIV